MSGKSLDQDLDLHDFSEEELRGIRYANGVSEFRSKVVCLRSRLATKPPQRLDLALNGQSYSIFISMIGGNLNIGLSRGAGDNPTFPSCAHVIITPAGLLRVSSDGLNVVPPQQPLQPYVAPGPEGVDPNVQVRTWLDPFINGLFEAVSE